MRFLFSFFGVIFLLLLVSCGGNQTKQEADYDTTKKMIIDVLQTEEGKKTIQQLMNDDELRNHLVIDSSIVRESIHEVFSSDQALEMWQKLFNDPLFVQDFAQSMAEEQMKIMKSLMNDAEFQKHMIEILQNPEMQEQMLQVMKSQEFRSHLEETIQQTLNTPLFLAKITEVLLQAAEKEKSEKESQSTQKEDEETESSRFKERDEGGQGEPQT